MSPVAINGIDKQGVDINGVQEKQALSNANETVNKGVYEATTLSAVDADLAVANIKSGVTIFGKLGTAPSTATHDIANIGPSALVASAGPMNIYYYTVAIASGADLDIATLTQAYTAGCIVEAYGYDYQKSNTNNTTKLRLYMNGVQVAESSFEGGSTFQNMRIWGSAALSGNKIVKIAVHNYDPALETVRFLGKATALNDQTITAEVFAGSVKVV